MRHERGKHLHHSLDIASFECSKNHRCGLEGHGLGINAGHRLEKLSGDVLGAADVGGAHVKAARTCFRRGNELRSRVNGRVSIHHQRQPEKSHGRYWRKVAHRVIAQAAKQGHADRMALVKPEQGVAIGGCLGHDFRGYSLAGTGPVINQYLLTEHFRQTLGEQPGNDVGRAARPIR